MLTVTDAEDVVIDVSSYNTFRRSGTAGRLVVFPMLKGKQRKKELIPFATAWMELESIMLSEISQAVRDKYHMISPLTGT